MCYFLLTLLFTRQTRFEKKTDQSNYVGMLLLDIQKAFNTVDHSILIVNLSADGLSKDSVRWFSSYLLKSSLLISVELFHLQSLSLVVCHKVLFSGRCFSLCMYMQMISQR